MRGVWRAWIAALGLGLVPVAAIVAFGQPSSFGAGVLLTGLLAAIPGLAALKPTLAAERFVKGMRRSCGRVHTVEDELGWRLQRKLLVETPVGAWRIEGTVNPLTYGVTVKPPNAQGTYHVRESPVEAGRVLMARLLTAQPALEEDSPVATETRSPSVRGRNTALEGLR